MLRPPKDDTKWSEGLILSAKEADTLAEILHYVGDVLPRSCDSLCKKMLKMVSKFHKDMVLAKELESLKGKKIKPSKVDLELAERCLARLEEENKCPCCGYPKCGHEHGKSKVRSEK